MTIDLPTYFKEVPDTTTLPDAYVANAGGLLDKVNALLASFAGDYPLFTVHVNSGFRTVEHNATVPGAAPNSKHTTGQAIDIGDDRDRTLAVWCLNNVGVLAVIGLWCEDFRSTPTWCHFQCVPPGSGNRFFIPSAAAARELHGPLTVKSLQG